MALPVLDGNQSATTLSSVVTGGEHIVAHSVVCLGSTAIANITNAVSGSVVSISNFPSTQTIAGTVTANVDTLFGSTEIYLTDYDTDIKFSSANPFPISGTVTATIRNGEDAILNDAPSGYTVIRALSHWSDDVVDNEIKTTSQTNPLPISGTVTVGAMPNGALTTRFGTPTTANTAFETSAVTNASRKYLLIQNVTTGSNVITVGIGFTPTTTQGIQLTAGAGITFESSYIPTGQIFVLSSVTASNFTILEA